MMVSEYLHCLPSEVKKKMRKGNGYVDYFKILAYLSKKSELENEAMERAKKK
jgi:hypothetical protein